MFREQQLGGKVPSQHELKARYDQGDLGVDLLGGPLAVGKYYILSTRSPPPAWQHTDVGTDMMNQAIAEMPPAEYNQFRGMGQTSGQSSRRQIPDVNMVFSEAPIHHSNPGTSKAPEIPRYNWHSGVRPPRQQRYTTIYPDMDILRVSQNRFGYLALTPRRKSVTDSEIKQEHHWFNDVESCSESHAMAEGTLGSFFEPPTIEEMNEMMLQHTKQEFDPSQLITPPGPHACQPGTVL